MLSAPKVTDRAAQPYVAIRAQVAMPDFPSVIDAAFPETFAWLADHTIPPAGAPLIRYLVIDMPAKLDVEIGVPVPTRVPADGRVSGGILPAGRYATILSTGPYSGLVAANAALLAWIAAQGLVIDRVTTPQGDAFGARVEFYLTDPRAEPDTSRWETEVAIRLADEPRPGGPA